MSGKKHSPVWARRRASEWLLACAEESRIAQQLIDDYGRSPVKRVKHFAALEDALDEARRRFRRADRRLDKAWTTVVQEHCPTWCDASNVLDRFDHGAFDSRQKAEMLLARDSIVHTRRFNKTVTPDARVAHITANVEAGLDGRWLFQWLDVNLPTRLEPMDAALAATELSEASQWLMGVCVEHTDAADDDLER